jgi:hypothetical protein
MRRLKLLVAPILVLFVIFGVQRAFRQSPPPQRSFHEEKREPEEKPAEPPAKASRLAPARSPAHAPPGDLQGGLAELEAESSQRWLLRKRDDGTVTKISEGALYISEGRPEEKAMKFMKRFGRNVFGLSPHSLGMPEVVTEHSATQVIIPMSLNGLPILGARANLIFDSAGSLVYAAVDGYRDPAPSPTPAISGAAAGAAAHGALLRYLSGRAFDPASYPPGSFHGALMYRSVEGSLSLVYKFEVTLAAPLIGDIEILVDASLGTAVLVRNLTRK